jgi:hypothetical protein
LVVLRHISAVYRSFLCHLAQNEMLANAIATLQHGRHASSRTAASVRMGRSLTFDF